MTPLCHPERKHHGRGMCQPCYMLHRAHRERSPDAVILGRELERAMTARNMTGVDVAKAAGISPTTVSDIRRGFHVAQHSTMVRMATVLDWEKLAYLSGTTRQAVCEKCDATFVRNGKNAARNRFCSKQCAHSAYRTNKREYRARFYKMQLQMAREAIAAFCKRCEPVDFQCHDAKCELREFSPFPLIQLTKRAA